MLFCHKIIRFLWSIIIVMDHTKSRKSYDKLSSFGTPYSTALYWDSRQPMYFILQNIYLWHFQFMLIFSSSFSDEVIAKCRTLNWERNEMGKIYDLLFVRVVKMCSLSSFHTKDIKLDSINSRELEECPVHKSDVENLQWQKSSPTHMCGFYEIGQGRGIGHTWYLIYVTFWIIQFTPK